MRIKQTKCIMHSTIATTASELIKYLGCVSDKACTDGAEFSRKVASEKQVVGVIRSLVNARDLQIEWASLA